MTHIETWRLICCLIGLAASMFSLGMTTANLILNPRHKEHN